MSNKFQKQIFKKTRLRRTARSNNITVKPYLRDVKTSAKNKFTRRSLGNPTDIAYYGDKQKTPDQRRRYFWKKIKIKNKMHLNNAKRCNHVVIRFFSQLKKMYYGIIIHVCKIISRRV